MNANPERRSAVSAHALIKLKHYLAVRNFGRAFAYHLLYIELNPLCRAKHEHLFAKVLYLWGTELSVRNKIDSVWRIYMKAIQYYPKSAVISNNLGCHMMRLHEHLAAKRYIEYALKLDPNYLIAQRNLENVVGLTVPRWHFRMLNDHIRNDSYRRAIQKCINPIFNKVVDVGAGCGLLSMFAATSDHVQKITAIEQSDVLCDVAKKIFDANNITNITLINKASYKVPVTEIDANILVTEIFDAALFGEHMLETLTYALNFVMSKDNWKVIPCKAIVYVTGICSNDIIKKHKVLHNIPAVNLNNLCITEVSVEPYEAEYLKTLNIKYMTDTVAVGEVNFNDYQSLLNLHVLGEFCPKLSLKCLQNGRIDAFAVWFDLYLDEEIKISTSPFEEDVKCWEQAIFYQKHPLIVEKEEEIQLKVSVKNNCLKIDVLDKKTDCPKCFEVSQQLVSMLNDDYYINKVLNVVDKVTEPPKNLLDLQLFPLFALQMAKRGSNIGFITETENDRMFFKHVLEINNITNANIFLRREVKLIQKYIKKIDFVFSNPYNFSEVPNEFTFNNSWLFLVFKPTTVILPKEVRLVLQLIDCDYIDYFNKVDDKNLCNFKVAGIFNEYMVYEHIMLKNQTAYKCLTPAIQSIQVTHGGQPVQHLTPLPVTKSGRANAILYWFNANYMDQVKFDTSKSYYFTQSCTIMKKPIQVYDGDIVNLHISFENGLLRIGEHSLARFRKEED